MARVAKTEAMGLVQVNILAPAALVKHIEGARGRTQRSLYLRLLLQRYAGRLGDLPVTFEAPRGSLSLVGVLLDQGTKDAIDRARGLEPVSSFLKRFLWWTFHET